MSLKAEMVWRGSPEKKGWWGLNKEREAEYAAAKRWVAFQRMRK